MSQNCSQDEIPQQAQMANRKVLISVLQEVKGLELEHQKTLHCADCGESTDATTGKCQAG